MASISDIIEKFILDNLGESDEIDISRNELANFFSCAPSQINYVITSRFTPEQGYIVESRRGGGGYIRITRVKMDKSTAIMHIVNSIGTTLDKATAEVMIKNMYNQSIIDMQTAKLLMSAMSERVFVDIPQNYRDVLRARIFKNMILTLCD